MLRTRIQVCLKIHLDPDPDPGSKKINKKMFQNIPVKLSKCNGKSILSNPLTTINYFSFFSFWILKFSHGCGSVRIRIQYCTVYTGPHEVCALFPGKYCSVGNSLYSNVVTSVHSKIYANSLHTLSFVLLHPQKLMYNHSLECLKKRHFSYYFFLLFNF